MERAVDALADNLRMDPWELRMRNIAVPGDTAPTMDVLTPSGVSQSDELDYTLHNPVTLQDVTIP